MIRLWVRMSVFVLMGVVFVVFVMLMVVMFGVSHVHDSCEADCSWVSHLGQPHDALARSHSGCVYGGTTVVDDVDDDVGGTDSRW